MIAPSFHAYLRSRGVRLSLAGAGRLRVLAPAGVVDELMQAFIARHAAELAAFVYALEERAAVLEHDGGLTRAEAELRARDLVPGGCARPDGQLWMREFAATHPRVREVLDVFGGEVESVRLTT